VCPHRRARNDLATGNEPPNWRCGGAPAGGAAAEEARSPSRHEQGNSIRGILKHLDDISDDDITGLEVPTGVPLVYSLDKELRPIKSEHATGLLSGYFLGDADAIAAAQQKVADQTKVK
jgi:hypothetical protein